MHLRSELQSIALLVMPVISKEKGITLAEKMAPSNKTKIAPVADVTGFAIVSFDRYRKNQANA
jgi:hypothetical protein